MFIALVGPDGAGKTTVAEALERAARGSGLVFRYQHWVPTRSGASSQTVGVPANPPPKLAERRRRPSDAVVSSARLGRNLARFWIGYRRSIRPFRASRETLVVADRWIYNYLGQPHSVAFYGPKWLARIGVRLAPRPDFIVVLDVPGAVASGRKNELSEDEADREMRRWRELASVWANAITVDGCRSPDDIAAEILHLCLRPSSGSQ